MVRFIIDGKRFGNDLKQEVEFESLAEALDVLSKEVEFSREYITTSEWEQESHDGYWRAYLDEDNYLVLEVVDD